MEYTASNNQQTNTSYSPTKPLTIYGSGADLSNAMGKYNGSKDVSFVDTSQSGFDPSTMTGGIMLGGTGVNKNVTSDILNKSGIQRVWGNTATDTASALDKYMSSYNKPVAPTAPTQINTPTYSSFNFSDNMQTYLDQAQGILKPQYDLNVKQLNNNYDSNIIPGVNNDTLKRGLARSSYAGNRVDQANEARQDDLSNLAMAQQQQVNNLGMQNYNTAYDRAYRNWNDTLNNNWKMYDAQSNANQQSFQNSMGLYNSANENYWNDKNYNQQQAEWNWQQVKDKNDESWKKIQYDYQKERDAVGDKQWNTTFEYQKAQDAIANSFRGSSRGGGSSGGRKSSGSSKSSSASQKEVDNAAITDFDNSSVQTQYGLLSNPDFTGSISTTTLKYLKSQYQKNLANSGYDESLVKASQPTWNYQASPSVIYSGSR